MSKDSMTTTEARFNVYIKTQSTYYSLLDIPKDDLEMIVAAFHAGDEDVLIDGVKYFLRNVFEIRVFTYDRSETLPGPALMERCVQQGLAKTEYLGRRQYLPPEVLKQVGQDVTKTYIAGKQGSGAAKAPPDGHYVDPIRITEIEKLASGQFDFAKLLQLLKELNVAHANGLLLSIPMLVRAIIDHVPPVFDKASFTEVCGAHGSKSFQDSMNNLNKSSRKIADSYLHTQIRNRENLPTPVQVNFRTDLDVLLQEVVRVVG